MVDRKHVEASRDQDFAVSLVQGNPPAVPALVPMLIVVAIKVPIKEMLLKLLHGLT